MRLIGDATVDDMVLAFLRAEVDAPRYRQFFVNLDRRLIDAPDLTNPAENRMRRQMLDSYRGVF